VRPTAILAACLLSIAVALAACGNPATTVPSGRISVVAAEDQYGSIASAIGGRYVYVTSLLSNPNTDPHEFEASASTARMVSGARLVIENGLGYDSWIDRLLSASPDSDRKLITVGSLLGRSVGDNPHVWYMPAGWPKIARVVAGALSALDPKHRAYYRARATAWIHSLEPAEREIRMLRRRTAGKTVIATEPVYGYMLQALGLTSLDGPFQKAIMDGTDPSPRSVADFQEALQNHTARLLFYNSQVSDPMTVRMRSIASQFHVPQVGITETKPRGRSFAQWQLSQLKAVGRAW
jgi:zinc/manganese transport system substrate-binding protein